MFLKSKDIAISLQGGELVGAVCPDGEKVTVALAGNSFAKGKALRQEPFEQALKALFSSLVSKLTLIPPRVIFTGYFDSDGAREFVKNSIVRAGARELVMLERAMAVCLGNEGELGKDEKRVYFLWDDGVLECTALEGVQTISSVRIEAETIYSLGSNFEFTAISCNRELTADRVSFLASHLDSLNKYGFPVESSFLWSPSAPPTELWGQIEPLVSNLILVDADAPLKGSIALQKNLKSILKGGFKKKVSSR